MSHLPEIDDRSDSTGTSGLGCHIEAEKRWAEECAKMAMLAFVFLAGCFYRPTLTLAQLDAQDPAYCKQQRTQRYADCRKERLAYRQVDHSMLFQQMEFREMHDLMCMGGPC
jgi:hypothetical protein